ncbi:ribosome biogenesis protein tsr1 [Malassezia psittaci]|uniref:Ribosome biogenesis protein tsr1 n=1 Tax=Malassezia psittaci TaxID=1821823 RepID=A0AAF0JCP5_9BASI|nr:ribosome biogenesis protein tsr1 [Malassezia psittaci]
MPPTHRPTLKQTNKKFKSGHATKGAQKRLAKGKHEAQTKHIHKGNPLRAAGSAPGSRSNRRNEAKQISQQKRAAILESTRIFTGSGLRGEQRQSSSGPSKAGAPRICAVVALTPDTSAWDMVRALEQDGEALGLQAVGGRSADDAQVKHMPYCELEAHRFRQTLQFLPLPYGALLPVMDACRCADFVVFVLSASTSIEPGSWGELCLRTLQAQGMPMTMAVVPTLLSADDQPWAKSKKQAQAKDAQGVRKSLLSFVQYFAPDVQKIHVMDEAASRSVFVRTLVTSAPKRVAWRDFRSWLVAEDAEFVSNDDQHGMLKVQGWIRGAPLSANRLVHIPDFGDFAVDRITFAPKHASRQLDTPMEDAASINKAPTLQAGDILDQRQDDQADELISENQPDNLMNEQTWPTEEEMADAPAAQHGSEPMSDLPAAAPGTTPREILKKKAEEDARKRYQAAWIIEEDQDDDALSDGQPDFDDEQDMSDDAEDSASLLDAAQDSAQDDDQDDVQSEHPSEQDEDALDLAALEAYRAQQRQEREAIKEEKKAVQFPDEVDTPLEVPARRRFARYRGLESIYTSHWDPYEDLPQDYARLFQFDDFNKTRKRVESDAMMEGVSPGIRVCVWIMDVPNAAAQRAIRVGGYAEDNADGNQKQDTLPFVLFGLMRHEHKKSVVNFTITRNTEYEAPVRSKDPLLVCLGFRRYYANPVYSQHVRNIGRRGNDVYKFERYLPHGIGAAVGSIYAPVTFGGANIPVVLMRMRSESKEFGYDDMGISAEQSPHLVGAGSVLDVAPTRIIAKRLVLSGHPYKLHKRTATIRFMFFNADDVRYFQPITLHTKMGRTGHISESLGTHGYFKAHFDGPLSQMDTVLMSLYKRVYPRWSSLFTASRQGLPLLSQSS